MLSTQIALRQKTGTKYINAIKLVKESLDEPERKKMVE
jgi:hypothetical protein